MAVLESILKIQAVTSGAEGIARLRQGVTDLGKAGKAAEGGLKGMGGAVAGLSGLMGALTPLLSVAGIMALGNKALETGDKLYDMAQRTGVSVEALARFSKAAATNGTDLDSVAKGLGKLSKGMMDAATTGAGPAAQALQVLGISATDASGQLLGADEVMLRVADRFKTLPDGATKTALAMQLFGKAGAELIPMLNQGGEAISKLSVKMTAEFAAKADEYKDKMTMLGGAVNGLGVMVADVLLPTLIDSADGLLTMTKQVVAYIESSKAGLQTVMNWISGFGQATAMAVRAVIENVAMMARVLGRLSMGDFGGAIEEAKAYVANFVNQAGKDFQQLGATITGTGKEASGAVSTVKQQMLDLTTAQEKAKEQQAQWKAWVDQTEASYSRMQFAVTQAQQKVAGDGKVMDARVGAELAISNAAKATLQIKLSTAKTDAERLGLTQQIAAIEVNQAKLQLNLTKAQAEASVQEAALAIQKAKTGQAQAIATLAEAQARGVVTTQYEKALEAQVELVQQTIAEYNVARAVAAQKGRAADATYAAAVAQAQASVSAMRLQIQQNAINAATASAANNIRQMPSSLDAAAASANRLAGSLERGAAATSMALGLGGYQPTVKGVTVLARSAAPGRVQGSDYGEGTIGFAGRQVGALPRFAAGGFVQGPTVAEIGEGGESEYVIPASKMARASSAFLAGARGAAVLSPSTGTTSIERPQINITTGPVLQFNGERYVKLEDLERAMRVTADGVISRLRTPAARIALGMG